MDAESIAYGIRHQALKDYVAELEDKHKANRADRHIVNEALAARAALLRLERDA